MRTKLAAIAMSGFAVSAICLGGAFALGGSAIGDTMLRYRAVSASRVATPPVRPRVTSRTLPWDGNGDRAAVAVAANTSYRAGSGDQLVVKGDSRHHLPCLCPRRRGGDRLPYRQFVSQQGRTHRSDVAGAQFPGLRATRQRRHAAGRAFAAGRENFRRRLRQYRSRRQDRASEGGDRRFGQSCRPPAMPTIWI